MATSRGTWKAEEREVADDWGTKRNPLSGANNTSDSGRPRPGDIIMPAGFNALVEVKYRASHAHHTLFKAAREDAKKHGIHPLHVFLYTKMKHERGRLVTMDGDFFKQLLQVPGVRDLLKEATSFENDGQKRTSDS